jgi:hypothetical protein
MEYIVLKSAHRQPYNYIIDSKSKERLYMGAESMLYRQLQNNLDITEIIAQKVQAMKENEVIKSLQQEGRNVNRILRRTCYHVFDTLGWDQYKFDIGYHWALNTAFDSIDDIIKQEHLSMIEEAFFTMGTRDNFYKFLREYAEGSIVSKKHIVAILKDMLEGVAIEDSWRSEMDDQMDDC